MEISFGDRLRASRIKMAFNQSELAARVGLRAAAISKYEKNQASPNIETLAAICRVLSVSSDWLLGISPETHQEDNMDSLLRRVLSLSDSSKERLCGYLDALGFPEKS